MFDSCKSILKGPAKAVSPALATLASLAASRRGALLAVVFCLLGFPAAAQNPPEDPGKIAKEGLDLLQSGQPAAAVPKLTHVIELMGDSQDLEPIYFSLGAAYYNIPDFEKAITTFRKYLTAFPKGPHRQEVVLSLSQALVQAKQYKEAIGSIKELEDLPQFREQALLLKASAFKESGNVDGAIATLEKLVASGAGSQSAASAAIQLAGYYAEKKDVTKAMATLQLIRQRLGQLDNLMTFNLLATQMGDNFLGNGQPAEALSSYRFVQPHEQLIKFQENRVKNLQAQIEKNQAALLADPAGKSNLIAVNGQLRTAVEDAGKLVEQARTSPDFTPALDLRIARAYYQMGKKWHAAVAYDEVLRRYPTAPEHEAALFGATVSSAEAGRVGPSRTYCDLYLKTYPSNPNAATVGFLLGATALQSGDSQGADEFFGRILQEQPDSQFREDMIFLMGNARFALNKFDDAGASYALYLKEYPKGKNAEEVVYRRAMARLFSGKYEEALGQLQEYQKTYPNGQFSADVGYRIDVCKYAASLYDEVIADTTAWEAKYKENSMLGEVIAIKADALAATDQEDRAISEYVRSYKMAETDEVLNYSLFAAQKLMQKKSDWQGMSDMFQEFVSSHPSHPTVVSALYWIGRAKVREGKVDEARALTADTIKKFIDDPDRDAVEQLLTQLAQLCVKKAPSPAATAPGASPAPTPVYDPQVELNHLLGSGSTPTGKARVLFAKAELARLKKKTADQESALQAIADGFKPEELSAVLLAQVGDFLLEKNQLDKAQALFQRLMTEYPRSDYVDFSWNGLGEIAFRRKDYPKALSYFTDAIEKVGAVSKLKDVTVGQAKTLLALGKLEEARKLFQQVISTKEWRGEATAFSVYSLGEIEQKSGHLPEAIVQYQKVFVAYQRYPAWVAKSYLSSAECFEKLGKTQDASRTYQEMLRQEKLASQPEFATARERLKALSPG